MKWGFINASPNANGHTAQLGAYLLADQTATTWSLVDYNINQLGQQRDDDFLPLIGQVAACDALLIGTPVYWSDMTGLLKTFLDRCTLVAKHFDFSAMPTYALIDGTQTPATTAPGIAVAVAQLADFLKLTYREAVYVDTSVIKRRSDFANALATTQQHIRTEASAHA
ncbi:NAD(P)H-dependent oxidoreductase [Lacticaseibacillus sp. GG6-2]